MSNLVKVKAKKMVFFGMKRRREGDVFEIPRERFSPKCMKPIDWDPNEKPVEVVKKTAAPEVPGTPSAPKPKKTRKGKKTKKRGRGPKTQG